ncbi:MAG TPA: AzlD domain-containing protein [Caldimonas sp.]|jgi:branched-subunit amino acid transport protein
MTTSQPAAWTALTLVGLAVVTVVTRGFFLYARREPRIPEPLLRALQVAPLAAIVAVLAPEIFMIHGHLVGTWRDARLPAALAATLFYIWRPGVLGPLLAGLAVYLPLHLALGW